MADAAVPATFRGSAVNLDLGGRVTLFDGNAIAWDLQGQARRIDLPLPLSPTHFAFDAMGRRALTIGAPALRGREFYLYEGSDRIASVEPTVEFPNGAAAHFTFLFDGVDHPLRLGAPVIATEPSPPPPLPPQKLTTTITPAVVAYYELDLAGNVRRLRGRDGADLGGYRYTAFGKTLESTVVRALIPKTTFGADSQPLRWKGMWRFEVKGVELYDARARLWAPELGSFLSVDEYDYLSPRTTLWGWPGQNPIRYRDPSGHYAEIGWIFTAPLAPGSAISGEVGVASVGASTGPFAVFALAAGAIIVPAAFDIMSQLDEFEHPTVTHGSGGENDPSGKSCPAPTTSSQPEAKPGAAPTPEAAGGGAGKRIGGGTPRTPHGQQRADEARAGDQSRNVGDENRVIREGRQFTDTETGNTIYVAGPRVVIVNSAGEIVTRWSGQTRGNTQYRIRNGKWVPKP